MPISLGKILCRLEAKSIIDRPGGGHGRIAPPPGSASGIVQRFSVSDGFWF